MSQIQSFVLSEGPGTGPIFTLTGDTGGAITPTNPGGNINIEGQVLNGVGFVTVAGTLGNNTLNILPLLDELTTNDATRTYFPNAFYTLTPSHAVVMTATVVGHKSDFSAASGGFCTGVARMGAAGGAIVVGGNTISSEDSTTGVAIFAIGLNGNNIQVSVAGVAGETWNWTCTFQYLVNLI